jgi:hypothetical protein
VRKGVRRAGWVLGIALVAVIALALTSRRWIPTAARVALGWRGVHVKRIAWEGKDAVKLEDIEIKKPAGEVRIKTITAVSPFAWRKLLARGSNDLTFVTVNGWKIVSKGTERRESKSIAVRIRELQDQLAKLQTNCPRAVILNGIFENNGKEFRFGAVEWKDGMLAGDFTWPALNDPAEFKLTRTNLIVKQIALEIGARFAFDRLGPETRVVGYARWKTNRVDVDLTFPPNENLPRQGFVRSKGLSIPGQWIGLPQVEQLNARASVVITNGEFTLRVGELYSETPPAP